MMLEVRASDPQDITKLIDEMAKFPELQNRGKSKWGVYIGQHDVQ